MKRSRMLALVAAAIAAPLAGPVFAQAVTGRVAGASTPGTGIPITVYRSPTCGCCKSWAEYLQDRGFEVELVDMDSVNGIKARYGVSPRLASCHTAIVDGYVIEGHVPADDIRRLLRERPAAVGLTAPGMPMLSPGMHSIEPKDYDVLLFDRQGRVAVYSSY